MCSYSRAGSHPGPPFRLPLSLVDIPKPDPFIKTALHRHICSKLHNLARNPQSFLYQNARLTLISKRDHPHNDLCHRSDRTSKRRALQKLKRDRREADLVLEGHLSQVQGVALRDGLPSLADPMNGHRRRQMSHPTLRWRPVRPSPWVRGTRVRMPQSSVRKSKSTLAPTERATGRGRDEGRIQWRRIPELIS
jgi:hypothetical protein